jgi:hypothetical protein
MILNFTKPFRYQLNKGMAEHEHDEVESPDQLSQVENLRWGNFSDDFL